MSVKKAVNEKKTITFMSENSDYYIAFDVDSIGDFNLNEQESYVYGTAKDVSAFLKAVAKELRKERKLQKFVMAGLQGQIL